MQIACQFFDVSLAFGTLLAHSIFLNPLAHTNMKLDIPLIDVSPFWSLKREDPQTKALLNQIDLALKDIGFLCITGTPLSASYIENAQAVAQRFFDLPLAEKLKTAAIKYKSRGYTALGEQGLSYAMDAEDIKQNTVQPADLFERYRIGPIDDFTQLGESVKPFLETAYAPNQWPYQVASFESVMKDYYKSMNQLSRNLLKMFALTLDLDENWFEDKVDKGMSSLAINHYPTQETPPLPGQLRAGAHADFGTLTIVAATSGPGGLQIRNKNKEWIDVSTNPNCLIVNIGDMMAQWSNDRWVSTVHRVVNPPAEVAKENKRLSMVFFHQPNPDAVVSCIPTCASESNPIKYKDTLAGVYISEKINRNFKSYRSA